MTGCDQPNEAQPDPGQKAAVVNEGRDDHGRHGVVSKVHQVGTCPVEPRLSNGQRLDLDDDVRHREQCNVDYCRDRCPQR